MILAYEAMRGLRPTSTRSQTPLETAQGVRLADEVVLVAILRAGLGLVDGFLRLVPDARVGHLGMYRDEEALRPVGYYENIPSGVADAEVFVVDPMLATGGSATQAIARLKRAGAQRRHVRLPGRRARGRRGAARAPTPRSRSSPPRSTASSTATAISAPGWATRAIASSEPTAEDERRFRRLVDANVVGVTISDDDRVLESNDAWLAIVGRTREELEAGAISWRAITAPEWAAQDDHVTRRLDAEGWVAPYEKEYVRPDGTRAPVLISGVTLDRDPLRVVAVVIDLTERHAADRERELLLAREREARARGRAGGRPHAPPAARHRRAVRGQLGRGGRRGGRRPGGRRVLRGRRRARLPRRRRGRRCAYDRGFEDTAMASWRRFPMRLDSPVCDVAAHRRAGVPGDARRLGALRRAAQPDHGHLPGDGRRAADASPAASPARWCSATRDARRFMAADRAFLASLADQAAHALERARLYEERAYVARTLQDGLLPERLADVPGLEVAVRYHSIADGGAVGGDFYDCFDISPGRWLVAVGDVAGKGTAAAVLTGLARHTLRAIALRDERPEDMLRFLNEALRRQSAESAFCTVGCATLDARDGGGFDVRLASGGHPYPLLVRAGGDGARRWSCAARCSASRPTRCSSRPRSRSAPGDTLVLYTDGVTDARDPSGEQFGEERLRAALQAAARRRRGGGRDRARRDGGGVRAERQPRRPRDRRAARQPAERLAGSRVDGAEQRPEQQRRGAARGRCRGARASRAPRRP